MDYRDNQLNDFLENGERCDEIPMTATDADFDGLLRADQWMQKLITLSCKKRPITSIFDGCPAPDNIEPEARPLTAPAQRKFNLDNRYDMIKDAVESKGEAQ